MKTTRKILTLAFALAIANITTIFAQNWAAGKKANPSTDFEYKLNDSGSGAAITAYIGKSAEVIIPEKLDKMPVTDIEGLSSNVQKVFMPDTVKTFTTKTFSGNKKLEEVVLSKNLIELPPRHSQTAHRSKPFTFPQEITTFQTHCANPAQAYKK